MREALRRVWLTTAIVLAGCGGADTAGDQDPAGAAEQEVRELPAGHPPVAEPPADSPPGMSVLVPPAGSGTGDAGLRWEPPASWREVPPSTAMRRAQYVVAGPGGEAECVVYYFGPGQGGGAQDNALRWADQFSRPDGGSSRDAMQTREIEVDGLPVLLVEVGGTYSGGMAMMGGPSRSLADHLLLGAIAEGPDANWFFKLTGPEATVAPQREAFEAMVRSIRRGGG